MKKTIASLLLGATLLSPCAVLSDYEGRSRQLDKMVGKLEFSKLEVLLEEKVPELEGVSIESFRGKWWGRAALLNARDTYRFSFRSRVDGSHQRFYCDFTLMFKSDVPPHPSEEWSNSPYGWIGNCKNEEFEINSFSFLLEKLDIEHRPEKKRLASKD